MQLLRPVCCIALRLQGCRRATAEPPVCCIAHRLPGCRRATAETSLLYCPADPRLQTCNCRAQSVVLPGGCQVTAVRLPSPQTVILPCGCQVAEVQLLSPVSCIALRLPGCRCATGEPPVSCIVLRLPGQRRATVEPSLLYSTCVYRKHIYLPLKN